MQDIFTYIATFEVLTKQNMYWVLNYIYIYSAHDAVGMVLQLPPALTCIANIALVVTSRPPLLASDRMFTSQTSINGATFVVCPGVSMQPTSNNKHDELGTMHWFY